MASVQHRIKSVSNRNIYFLGKCNLQQLRKIKGLKWKCPQINNRCSLNDQVVTSRNVITYGLTLNRSLLLWLIYN